MIDDWWWELRSRGTKLKAAKHNHSSRSCFEFSPLSISHVLQNCCSILHKLSDVSIASVIPWKPHKWVPLILWWKFNFTLLHTNKLCHSHCQIHHLIHPLHCRWMTVYISANQFHIVYWKKMHYTFVLTVIAKSPDKPTDPITMSLF